LIIVLYDITKRYETVLKNLGIDVTELLEKLAQGNRIDVYTYVSKGHEYLVLSNYFFELKNMGDCSRRSWLY